MEEQENKNGFYDKSGNWIRDDTDSDEVAQLAEDPRCNDGSARDYVVDDKDTVEDDELKILEENDYGSVNGRALNYDSPQYKATGSISPAWGKSSVGEEESKTLKKGTIIVQWSVPEKTGAGTYFCALGTDYESLQLPQIQDKRQCKFYEVAQENKLEVYESEIAVQPWNKTKTTVEGTRVIQWRSSEKTKNLVQEGLIKEINIEKYVKTLIIKRRAIELAIFFTLSAGSVLSFVLTDTENIYNLLGWVLSSAGAFIFPLFLCSKFPAIAQKINGKKGGIVLLLCILFLNLISIFFAKILGFILFVIFGYWIISAGTSIFGAFVPTGMIRVERHEADGSINVEDHYVHEENMKAEMSSIETRLKNEGYDVKKDN